MGFSLIVPSPLTAESEWFCDRTLTSLLRHKLKKVGLSATATQTLVVHEHPADPPGQCSVREQSPEPPELEEEFAATTKHVSFSTTLWHACQSLRDLAECAERLQLLHKRQPEEQLLIASPFHPWVRPEKLVEALQVHAETKLSLVASGFRTWRPLQEDEEPFLPATRSGYAFVDAFLCGKRPLEAQPRRWGPTISLIDLELQEALDVRQPLDAVLAESLSWRMA